MIKKNNIILIFAKYIFPKDLIEIKKKKLIFIKPKKQFFNSSELLKIIRKYQHIEAIVYGDDQITKQVIRVLKSKGYYNNWDPKYLKEVFSV